MKRLADYNMTEEEMLRFSKDGRAYFEDLQKWLDADRVNDYEKHHIACLLMIRGDSDGANEVANTIESPTYRQQTHCELGQLAAWAAGLWRCVD